MKNLKLNQDVGGQSKPKEVRLLPLCGRGCHEVTGEGNEVIRSMDCHAITDNPPQTSIGVRKVAFTLAEVLITLGIIGVVAALTMPALISKYQKHVWYTQFMKAATVIENAINQYNSDHACETNDEDGSVDNLCIFSDTTMSPAEKLGEYMNIIKWINEGNYEEVCAGYKKLPVAIKYDGTGDRYADDGMNICQNEGVWSEPDDNYAFITNDGMLFNFATDINGNQSVVDVNGPNKGPNILGRDVFAFRLYNSVDTRWCNKNENGEYYNVCSEEDNKDGYDCGIRLLQEGKMNY